MNAQSPPMKGITMVAPSQPIGPAEIDAIQEVNAEWISLVPYGFSRGIDDPKIRYNLDRQWWGERAEGIEKCISLAHEKGIKIMLKPQVYIHGAWVGDISYDNENDWKAWENGYREFIHFYGKIAAKRNVEMLCIATEYKLAVQKRPEFWRTLIKEIRSYYDGELIYSSNWDSYDKVPIWDDLDYIGVSAYFPLSDKDTPTKSELIDKWLPTEKKLRQFSKKHSKQIVFTEYGYLSIDGCAGKTWELEKGVRKAPINQEAQANAYAALLENFMAEDWWGGGFLWKWFPAGMGHEGYPERDYTPQNKLSQSVIAEYYSRCR